MNRVGGAMIQIFTAENAFEAHLVRGRLEADGLRAEVRGEWLTGALGELPVTGLVGVWVKNEDVERARALLQQMEEFAETDDEAAEDLAGADGMAVLFA